MICALLIGREGSTGFPGKNLTPVLGRPLVAYPLIAANHGVCIDRVYVSTDSPRIAEIANHYGVRVIERPSQLTTKESLAEDVFVHGYEVIKNELTRSNETVELMVLLMANSATLTPEGIDKGIEVLQSYPDYDSAVTVSQYNMWSPSRARKIDADGLLKPFVPFHVFDNENELSCDRDSQGDVWFADMGLSIVRPRCLENVHNGLLPQRWMGQKIYPIKQWGGLDVDYEWQLPLVEYWLRAHGHKPPADE